MDILLTNHKLRSIHSESAPKSRSKASTYRYVEKDVFLQELSIWTSLEFCSFINRFTNDKFSTVPNCKSLQTTIVNCNENGRKLHVSKWVENTEGKGEIARYEQFLLFP